MGHMHHMNRCITERSAEASMASNADKDAKIDSSACYSVWH